MSTRAQLSEAINRLLPGEQNKRIRLAILEAATYSGSRTDQLRQSIDEANRLRTGKLVEGTVDFTSTTSADLSGFAWVVDFVVRQQDSTETVTVTAPDADYPRPDIFVGKADGSIEYRAGTIDEEGNVQEPSYDPVTEVLLAAFTRNPDNSNDQEDGSSGTSDFVSKSATGTEVMQGLLAFSRLARTNGPPQRVPNLSLSGVLSIPSSPAINDVYSTVEGVGATDWSKLVTIDISGGQLRYFAILEFAGVSPTYEKGDVWIQFQTDSTGALTVNRLKVFGEINPAKLKLVRLDSTTYGVFVHHNEAGAFFKFRPQHQFGPSSVYTYHHQDGRNPLPSGDQYDFSEYGGGETGGEGVTLNGKVIGGVKRLIEESDVLNIPVNWEYNVTSLVVDGIINNEGSITIL